MKIVIGAGETQFKGWYHYQESELNLLDTVTFNRLIPEKNAQCFLAEHVWEHLTLDEGVIAAKNCYNHLIDGGYLRIAVPDKNFNNEWYQNMVKVGGPGPKDHPSFTHKVLYDYKTLTKVLEKAGFEVTLLEYCDENGVFSYRYWNSDDGHIGRSFRYDTRNSIDNLKMVSLIVDAHKIIKI